MVQNERWNQVRIPLNQSIDFSFITGIRCFVSVSRQILTSQTQKVKLPIAAHGAAISRRESEDDDRGM
jgi:hypothetical protein